MKSTILKVAKTAIELSIGITCVVTLVILIVKFITEVI